MKKPILLVIYSMFTLLAIGQRVDLDKFYFNASYRILPRTGLDTSYRTFSVDIDAGRLTRMAVKESLLKQEVYIGGWRKLSSGGHIKINLRMEDVIVEKSDIKEREEIFKDKNGKETGRKKHYFMELTYSYGARALINDYRGSQLSNTLLMSRDSKHIYTSSEYDTKAEAQIFFAYNVIPVTSELSRNVAYDVVRTISEKMTYSYGFSQTTVNDFMWILDNRKHPEYEGHQQAWLTIKQALFQMSADEPLDRVREMVKPAIEYFEKVKKRYASSSKNDRKVRYASFYNLSKLYYYLDDPIAAMKEASSLVLNDFDARDGRMLEN